MTESKDIICHISRNTKVLIRAKSQDIDLNQPLYAINWFSTKIAWLYHFYNFLAYKSVMKIGGEAFFKAKVTETLLDELHAKRELLLIVRYPGGQHFKELMEMTYFKFVSIFRIFAVRQFTFGFTQKRIIDFTSSISEDLSYAIHHFKYEGVDDSLFAKFSEQIGENIIIKYAGPMLADLLSQQKSGPARAIPNLMDGLVVYEAKSKNMLLKMFHSEKYKRLIDELDSSYIGFLNRLL